MARTKVTIKKPDFNKWKNAVEELTVRTGLKIEEIAKETAPVDTGNYRSQITYDGSNTVIAQVKYSAAIEYGFDEYTEKVKEHQRVIKQAFGKALNPPVIATVKSFERTMNRKPKPVMRNAAKETQKQIPEIWEKVQKLNGL